MSDTVNFEQATEIATKFLREHGHTSVRLNTSAPKVDGWIFQFDVGVVSKKIIVVGVGKDGKIKRLEPLAETVPPPELFELEAGLCSTSPEIMKLPISLKIDLREVEDGKWEMTYTEGWRPEHREAFLKSVELVRAALPPDVKITVEGDTVTTEISGSRDVMFSFLAGEFLINSSVGAMGLKDLFAIVIGAGARAGAKLEKAKP